MQRQQGRVNTDETQPESEQIRAHRGGVCMCGCVYECMNVSVYMYECIYRMYMYI